MLRKMFLAAGPLALLAALLAATPAGSAPAAAAAVLFTDAGGDSGAAPDLTDVEVGNDVVAGPIVFWITLANRPNDLTGDDLVVVFLDTDQNPESGDGVGAEYALLVGADGSGVTRWDGAEHVEHAAPSLRSTYFQGDKALRVSVHPNELGAPTSFAFLVASLLGEEGDLAPNGPPPWTYQLASGRPRLGVVGFALAPKAPRAGKQFAARMAVARADINEILAQGKGDVHAADRQDRRQDRPRSLRPGRRRLHLEAPEDGQGPAAARGVISVTYGGTTVKRTFSARVR